MKEIYVLTLMLFLGVNLTLAQTKFFELGRILKTDLVDINNDGDLDKVSIRIVKHKSELALTLRDYDSDRNKYGKEKTIEMIPYKNNPEIFLIPGGIDSTGYCDITITLEDEIAGENISYKILYKDESHHYIDKRTVTKY